MNISENALYYIIFVIDRNIYVFNYVCHNNFSLFLLNILILICNLLGKLLEIGMSLTAHIILN